MMRHFIPPLDAVIPRKPHHALLEVFWVAWSLLRWIASVQLVGAANLIFGVVSRSNPRWDFLVECNKPGHFLRANVPDEATPDLTAK